MVNPISSLAVAAVFVLGAHAPVFSQAAVAPMQLSSDHDFPWETAKKVMSKEFATRNFRPSTIVGYQLDTPGKATALVFFQGGGTTRIPFYHLVTDSGRKWFLVLESERSAAPIAVE
jgi:hypothetical protein